MTSTTGTSLTKYIDWLTTELDTKEYGSVSLSFTVCRGQIVGVEKVSKDTEKIQLDKKH